MSGTAAAVCIGPFSSDTKDPKLTIEASDWGNRIRLTGFKKPFSKNGVKIPCYIVVLRRQRHRRLCRQAGDCYGL